MGRILAIDYGLKRCGIAQTDIMQMIATPLTTVPTNELNIFLKKHFQQESIDKVIIGLPKNLNNQDTHGTELVTKYIKEFNTIFPNVSLETYDERFTSKMAFQGLIDSGVKKKQRQDKGLIDQTSATIILQGYLENQSFRSFN